MSKASGLVNAKTRNVAVRTPHHWNAAMAAWGVSLHGTPAMRWPAVGRRCHCSAAAGASTHADCDVGAPGAAVDSLEVARRAASCFSMAQTWPSSLCPRLHIMGLRVLIALDMSMHSSWGAQNVHGHRQSWTGHPWRGIHIGGHQWPRDRPPRDRPPDPARSGLPPTVATPLNSSRTRARLSRRCGVMSVLRGAWPWHAAARSSLQHGTPYPLKLNLEAGKHLSR